jgi:hypothetical protein
MMLFFMISVPPWNFSGSSFTLTIFGTYLHRLYFFGAPDYRGGNFEFPCDYGQILAIRRVGSVPYSVSARQFVLRGNSQNHKMYFLRQLIFVRNSPNHRTGRVSIVVRFRPGESVGADQLLREHSARH